MFQAITYRQERGFETTQPPALDPHRASREAPAIGRLDDVLGEVRRNNRVCPMPTVWVRIHALLPNKPPHLPAVPATRDEWSRTPSLQKRARLREHIEWAERHGLLAEVARFIEDLPEEEWVHMG